jgi:hypothetical protein
MSNLSAAHFTLPNFLSTTFAHLVAALTGMTTIRAKLYHDRLY